MHIRTIPVQKYIAETGKKHKYKENATSRTGIWTIRPPDN